VKYYRPETPVIFISSSKQDFFYLFTQDGLDRFVVDSTKRGQLTTVFEQEIFTKLLQYDNQDINKIKNNQQIDILEAQDAFLHGDENTLLTYYVGIANSLNNTKIIHHELDLTDKAKAVVVKNIEDVQKFIIDKKIRNSFDDLKKQLTPMENPGEK